MGAESSAKLLGGKALSLSFLGFEPRNAGVSARATKLGSKGMGVLSLADKAVVCSFDSSVNGRAWIK